MLDAEAAEEWEQALAENERRNMLEEEEKERRAQNAE